MMRPFRMFVKGKYRGIKYAPNEKRAVKEFTLELQALGFKINKTDVVGHEVPK